MPKGKPVTAKDLNTFLERIAAGDTLTQAAETAGQDSPAPFYRRKDPRSPIYDPVFAQAFNEAVEEFLQRKRDLVDQTVEKRAKDPDAPPPIVSMWAKRWHPGYREKQQVEVTGEGGAPIQVESRGYTLGALIAFAAASGIDLDAELGHRPAEALSAAGEVRAGDDAEGDTA